MSVDDTQLDQHVRRNGCFRRTYRNRTILRSRAVAARNSPFAEMHSCRAK